MIYKSLDAEPNIATNCPTDVISFSVLIVFLVSFATSGGAVSLLCVPVCRVSGGRKIKCTKDSLTPKYFVLFFRLLGDK